MILGLGNPGPDHERDRHNVGFWFVEDLSAGTGFRGESKILAEAESLFLEMKEAATQSAPDLVEADEDEEHSSEPEDFLETIIMPAPSSPGSTLIFSAV